MIMLQRLSTTTKPIHVLVATPAGARGRGGIDRVMHALRGELDRQGVTDVTASFVSTRGNGHVALSPFYLAGFMARMLVLKAAGRLDLIHINLSSFGSTYRKIQIARLARLLGIPYVLHLHGANYNEFWTRRDTLLNRSIRTMFAGAAQVIVLGAHWRGMVIARCPEAAERVVIVPNATAAPTAPHKGGGDTVRILFLGRVGDRKGVPQLIEALSRMLDRPGWHATIAGDGDVEEAQAQATELGLSGRIDFPGWCDEQKVADLIAGADILALPSFAENLPMSVIEGMAAGLAIVTTNVGAVPDIIAQEETGLLVEAGDVDGLSHALTRVVADPALRSRLGTAALQFHRARLDLAPYAHAVSDVWKSAAN
jgi:glycosyltransferase involved in cell wall biosynthesis